MHLLTINHAGGVLPSTDRKRQWGSGGEVLDGGNYSERNGGSPDGLEMKRGSVPNQAARPSCPQADLRAELLGVTLQQKWQTKADSYYFPCF